MDLKEDVRIKNVLNDAKSINNVKKVNFVPNEDVFLPIARQKLIVDRTTNATNLKIVSLDVKKIKETVRRAKNVARSIVSKRKVIICVIWQIGIVLENKHLQSI